MVKSKDKGKRWEKEAEKILNESFGKVWKRTPGSGALGTNLQIPILQGDLIGDYYFLNKTFAAEAKFGYGGKSMTIQKEWFDKIREQAERTYSLPIVLLKFEYARTGVKYVVAMDFEAWDELLTEIEEMHTELLRLYEEHESEGSS